ncbi:MAG: inositol monophosphatase family protein [Deferrisomatales bacterium]|nr:inositol monophosphatase family protein [Deferrisomatales bacterium]
MIEIAVAAARAAGKIQRRYWGGTFGVRHKGAVDLVTEVDLACEEEIREVLARRAPGTAMLGEETGSSGRGADRWVVDPLDGTTNFAHGYPAFCVSIAWEQAGETVLGVVYDPTRDELFQAERGLGARRNGAGIRVSPTTVLADAILATGFPYDRATNPRNYDEFRHLTQRTQGVRRSGSAALDLAYVACGRLDGFWEPGLQPWDVAAGCLLITEAGGTVSGHGGGRFTPYDGDVAASNGPLHPALLEALAGATRNAP